MLSPGTLSDVRDTWGAAVLLTFAGLFFLAKGGLYRRWTGESHSTIRDPDGGWARAQTRLGWGCLVLGAVAGIAHVAT